MCREGVRCERCGSLVAGAAVAAVAAAVVVSLYVVWVVVIAVVAAAGTLVLVRVLMRRTVLVWRPQPRARVLQGRVVPRAVAARNVRAIEAPAVKLDGFGYEARERMQP